MNEYTVDIGGTEHTLLLDEEDAKRLGAKVAPVAKKAAKVANKSRAAANKES